MYYDEYIEEEIDVKIHGIKYIVPELDSKCFKNGISSGDVSHRTKRSSANIYRVELLLVLEIAIAACYVPGTTKLS
jgi:hypothetical protein